MADLSNFFKKKNIDPKDVGFKASVNFWTVGHPDYLGAFFDTVRALAAKQGKKYPAFLNELYMGDLPGDHAANAHEEWNELKQLLQADKDKAKEYERVIQCLDAVLPYAARHNHQVRITRVMEKLYE